MAEPGPTLEEAAEIVLRGPVYLTCTQCEGGFVGPVHKMGTESPHSTPLYLRQTCHYCDGNGNYLQPLYAFACGMTGAGLPERKAELLPAMRTMRQQTQWAIRWMEELEAMRRATVHDPRRSGGASPEERPLDEMPKGG
jgi:hypothetical protein